jgi:hypothetical protein
MGEASETDEDTSTNDTIRPGIRCRVSTEAGVEITEQMESTSAPIRRLAQGTLVVCAEVCARDGRHDRVRIASPAGWLDSAALEVVGSAPSLSFDYETFLARHLEVAPGDHYGLAFPISLDGLCAAGADFLTEAFRAAGVISSDNRVTEILEFEPLSHNGASDAALLSVAYASLEPDLHTDLFVKVSPTDVERKFTVSAMAHSEVVINRRSADEMFPVPVPKYYFGDYCTRTSNFLLITEQIAFGRGTIEPAWSKGYEHLVPDVVSHYRALAESLARVVTAHKHGTMGEDLERDFPFARSARGFPTFPQLESKLDWLIDFIGRVAPQLFVSEARDPAFLAKWREDVLFGLAHNKEVIGYLHADVDYTGLCHPNLNIDNAWYWRDAADALRVGWLDLGGFGQMSVAQAMNSMPMMCEPDHYPELEQAILSTFAATCETEGGPLLDLDQLRLHYRAAVLSVSLGLILGSAAGFLSPVPEEEFSTMADWRDPRLQESGLAAGIIWIDNVLRRWLDDQTPADAWREIVSRVGTT